MTTERDAESKEDVTNGEVPKKDEPMETDSPKEEAAGKKEQPVKISFGVKKKIDSLVVQTESKSVAALATAEHSDEEAEAEEERAAKRRKLTHFEDGSIPEDEVDRKKNASIVIPMVMEVDWRTQKLLEQERDGTISDADRARLAILVEANPALAEQRAAENGSENEGGAGAIVVDVLKKDDTVDADYNQVSIESFGLAILRGCGWKDGDGIGKNPQKVPLRLPERRPKGLGLGAAPKTDPKKNGAAGSSKDGEVSQELKAGSFIRITQGRHEGAYAKVESRDDDNSSLYARLALGGQATRVSLFSVVAVSQKEYERDGKCINKSSYDRESKRIEREEKEREESKSGRSRDKEYDERKKDKQERREEEMWARVDCVVRLVSEDYKKGRYLDKKMRVVDVADRKNITLEDESRTTHYNMRQSWIETVIPRNAGEKVMIVRGRYAGEPGVMEEKDRDKEVIHARLTRSQKVVTVRFDDACMWQPQVIDIDDE